MLKWKLCLGEELNTKVTYPMKSRAKKLLAINLLSVFNLTKYVIGNISLQLEVYSAFLTSVYPL
jgi:hypothetical protein